MGHQINYYTYALDCKKQDIIDELNEECEYSSDSRSGLPNPIRWLDVTLDDYDDAVKYIEAHQRQWYDQVAVKYKQYPRQSTSKAAIVLTDRIKKQKDALTKIVAESHVSNRTSEFIGCEKCGSKLKRTLLPGDCCPLCRTDLRSKTNLDRIANAKAKLDELNQKMEEQVKKDCKPVVKWLVKIEYHV